MCYEAEAPRQVHSLTRKRTGASRKPSGHICVSDVSQGFTGSMLLGRLRVWVRHEWVGGSVNSVLCSGQSFIFHPIMAVVVLTSRWQQLAAHIQRILSNKCINQAACKPLKPACQHSNQFRGLIIKCDKATSGPSSSLEQSAHPAHINMSLFCSTAWNPTTPSVSMARLLLWDCLGYGPLRPHAPSLSATCSPVYPTRLYCCLASRLCLALTSH